MSTWKIVVAVFAVIALVAGGFVAKMAMGAKAQFAEADAAIATMHAQIAAGQCDAVYQSTSSTFKQAALAKEFDKLCRAIPTKLGALVSTKVDNQSVNWSNGVEMLRIVHTTKFERAEATENFVFVRNGQRTELAGYHISSPAFLSD